MRRMVSSTRFIVLLGVIGLGLESLLTFLWGVVVVVRTGIHLALSLGADMHSLVGLLESLDIFLIAAALFIFAISLYELFIGSLNVPEWLVIRDIDGLKRRVTGIVVLVLGITFLEHLIDWTNPLGTLYFGLAIAAVALALTLLYNSGANH